jgi:hypothetical protein
MIFTRRRVVLQAVAAVAIGAAWQAAWGGTTPPLPTVLVSQVSNDPQVAAGEAWVAANPRNPSQVVVIWLGTTGDPNHLAAMLAGYCGVGRSTNGGQTWKISKLPLATTTGKHEVGELRPAGREYPICGDPMAGVGPDGTLYGAAVQLAAPSWTQGVTSSDFGAHWSAPYQVFGVHQTASALQSFVDARRPAEGSGRGFMAVDPITGEVSIQSQEDGAAEGRWITTSRDRGKTWSAPRPLDPDVQSATAGPQSAAGGTIAVAYKVDPTSPNYLTRLKPAVKCSSACTVFETSTDRGATWTRHVVKAAGGGAGPAVAADPSHPGKRFAMLVGAGFGLGSAKPQLLITNDGGATWTKTKTLTPAAGDSLSKLWISYSPTGTLGMVWRTTHSSGLTDVQASVSRDGGTTFSRVVTLAKGLPSASAVGPGDDCACNLYLDATTFSATWTSAVTGQREMYYGRFNYTGL